ILLVVLAVSILSTAALVLEALGFPLSVGGSGGNTSPIKPTGPQVAINGVLNVSYIVAPISWTVLSAMWIWRGKTRAKWNSSGFSQDSFHLLVKMKGGPTRLKLLDALGSPKDRSQLAQELGMDWKAVDRHIQLLIKYNFIREDASFGAIKLYTLTAEGEKLLRLIKDMSELGSPANFSTLATPSDTSRA
ncbi:MAG: winged helix-turn-helix domain-containing protein, partial [Nitrososphaerales archaeon]